MVRTVNTSSSSAGGVAGKRKRVEYEDAAGVKSSKKRYNDTASKSPERSQTPGTKNARFAKGKNLIRGATPAEPVPGGAQTPAQSNLRKPSDGANDQLLADIRASEDREIRSGVQTGRSRQGSPRKQSPARHGSTGLTQNLAGLDIAKGSRRNSASATKHRKQLQADHEFDAEDDELHPVTVVDVTIDAPTESYFSDSRTCDQINEMRRKVINFSQTCPPLPLDGEEILTYLFCKENEELVRYIGCLAISGPTGKAGWVELLGDVECRQALVLGIVGRALKEHVFSELYFGGDQGFIKELHEQQKKLGHLDGFERTKQRAVEIRKHNHKHKLSTKDDDPGFCKAVAEVTLQLGQLLQPLWNPSSAKTRAGPNRDHLAEIVSIAGGLSREFRENGDVVYYWPPTFKDEEFEPNRMECLNLRSMISQSPYDKQKINGFERAVLRANEENRSEAIVRIVCFPSLVAYRQAGGELADQELANEEEDRMTRASREKVPPDVKKHRKLLQSREQRPDRDNGFRTCIISKSVVWLQWGKQRLLTKEAGTSRHIDAMKTNNGMDKYRQDSAKYKELYDLWKEETGRKEKGQQVSKGFFERIGFRSPSLSVEPTSNSQAGGRSGGRSASRGRQ